MDDTGLLALIEELEDFLENTKPAFGRNSNLRQVDITGAFEILADIRDAIPAEVAQARRIVREHQALIEDAEAEKKRIIEDARAQALTIASEQEIVRLSQHTADQIIAEAREIERQTRSGAEDYADNVFDQVQRTLDSMTNSVVRCRERLNAGTRAPMR